MAASGLGDIYVVGLEDTAIMNLAGTATVTIKASNGELSMWIILLAVSWEIQTECDTFGHMPGNDETWQPKI